MSHATDRYLQVDGVRTRYRELGAGEPVLLIHGLGASIETWERTLPALARDHRVLALDLVGFGYSAKPEVDYTHAYLADFVLAFLDSKAIASASLVGHSLGGSLALRIAVGAPSRVRDLVLVDSAGLDRSLSVGLRLLTLPLLGEMLLKPSREKTRQALGPFFYDEANLTDRFVDLNYDLITQPGARRAYLSTVRNMASIFGLRAKIAHATIDRLDQVRQRTLIIWGEQDAIVPVSHGRAAETAIPDADLRVIEACGHLPMLERADVFNQVLTTFLAR